MAPIHALEPAPTIFKSVQEHHNEAAKHHELAGKHNREAALYHSFGERKAAAIQGRIARGHSVLAAEHETEAGKDFANG
jgi:hypothetical protein